MDLNSSIKFCGFFGTPTVKKKYVSASFFELFGNFEDKRAKIALERENAFYEHV
jgi:hypothetical protein